MSRIPWSQRSCRLRRTPNEWPQSDRAGRRHTSGPTRWWHKGACSRDSEFPLGLPIRDDRSGRQSQLRHASAPERSCLLSRTSPSCKLFRDLSERYPSSGTLRWAYRRRATSGYDWDCRARWRQSRWPFHTRERDPIVGGRSRHSGRACPRDCDQTGDRFLEWP
jgi:hypothetical protein